MAALSLFALGSSHLLAGTAAAHWHNAGTCCGLWHASNPWCPHMCRETDLNLYCWACNGGRCRCCECVRGQSCHVFGAACSYRYGCCGT